MKTPDPQDLDRVERYIEIARVFATTNDEAYRMVTLRLARELRLGETAITQLRAEVDRIGDVLHKAMWTLHHIDPEAAAKLEEELAR